MRQRYLNEFVQFDKIGLKGISGGVSPLDATHCFLLHYIYLSSHSKDAKIVCKFLKRNLLKSTI